MARDVQDGRATGEPVTKAQWRALFAAARRARPADERSEARQAIARCLLAALQCSERPLVVCAFHPLPSEPLAPELPAALHAAGMRVLVPAARPDAPLDWCDIGGPTRPGPLGVTEPTGPFLGPTAIRKADVVLVPALGMDVQGFRLGRGGGHYDRSLALLARPANQAREPGHHVVTQRITAGHDGLLGARNTRLIAVVFDDEVVARLPHGAHDIPVTDVITPSGGLRHVARDGPSGALSD